MRLIDALQRADVLAGKAWVAIHIQPDRPDLLLLCQTLRVNEKGNSVWADNGSAAEFGLKNLNGYQVTLVEPGTHTLNQAGEAAAIPLQVNETLSVDIHDVFRVRVEFRAPKTGELAWIVPASLSPQEILQRLLACRDKLSRWAAMGVAGFGYHTPCDMPEFEMPDPEGLSGTTEMQRNIVIHVEHIPGTCEWLMPKGRST